MDNLALARRLRWRIGMHTMRAAHSTAVPELGESHVGSEHPLHSDGTASSPPVSAESGGLVPLAEWFDPRKAVHEDDIMCLICGRTFRQLTNTHLRSHGTTTSAYKIRFGYNRRRPLMSAALKRLYVSRAVLTMLASRIRSRPILANPDLRRLGGRRHITLEEMLARRDARRRRALAAEAAARAEKKADRVPTRKTRSRRKDAATVRSRKRTRPAPRRPRAVRRPAGRVARGRLRRGPTRRSR